MYDLRDGGILMRKGPPLLSRAELTATLLAVLPGCLPRDNPYDPGNPGFIMPAFTCRVLCADQEYRTGVTGATVTFEYKGTFDSAITDSEGTAMILVEDNVTDRKIAVRVSAVRSSTHDCSVPFNLTLSRDGEDTTVWMHDRGAKPVPWDTLYVDDTGAQLIWHSSSSGEFSHYRLLRSNPSGTVDTIGELPGRSDTVFTDHNTLENTACVYRVDVVSIDRTVKKGDERSLSIPNRPPSPSRIVKVEPDFFTCLRLCWTRNVNDDFFRYSIYRSGDSIGFDPVHTVWRSEDTMWLDTTIDSAAHRYYYYVETEDSGALVSSGDTVSGINRVTLDSGLVYLHRGEFTMGRSGADVHFNQQPAHQVFLSSFLIDRYEVTIKRYLDFLNSGNGGYYNDSMALIGIRRDGERFLCEPSRAHHPMVWISWSDADTFCKWSGGNLPTEAQWEKSSRGNDGRLYPWGDSFYNGQTSPEYFLANYVIGLITEDDSGYSIDGARFTAPVGNYATGASYWGAYDMAGNVSEWCRDWYATQYSQNPVDPEGPALGLWRSYRGGSFRNYPEELISSYRFRSDPSSGKDDLGCRCVYETR